jgi:hypothetical protein
MEVSVDLKEWKVVTTEDGRKIAGEYNIKCGAMEIAKQQFNDGYSATKVLFPSSLVERAEQLTADIASAITKNFTGGM